MDIHFFGHSYMDIYIYRRKSKLTLLCITARYNAMEDNFIAYLIDQKLCQIDQISLLLCTKNCKQDRRHTQKPFLHFCFDLNFRYKMKDFRLTQEAKWENLA